MHATLADFGLAKPLREAEAAAGCDATGTGGTGTRTAHEAGDTPAGDLGDTMGVGTPRYMAPVYAHLPAHTRTSTTDSTYRTIHMHATLMLERAERGISSRVCNAMA